VVTKAGFTVHFLILFRRYRLSETFICISDMAS